MELVKMSENNYFRKEAVDYYYSEKNNKLLTAGTSVSPTMLWIIGIFSFSFLMLISLVPYSNKINVLGVLVPEKGLSRVHAKTIGVVSKVYANIGESVKEGDPIFAIKTIGPTSVSKVEFDVVFNKLKDRKALIESKISLYESEYNEKRNNLYNEVVSNEEKLKILQKISLLNKENYEVALKQLEAAKAVREKLAQYETDVIKTKNDVASNNINIVSVELSLKAFKNELNQLDIIKQSKIRDYELQKNDIDLQVSDLLSKYEYVITAPIAGVIYDVQVNAGDRIEEAIVMASIIPEDSPLVAKLYIPAPGIGLIKTGDPVEISFAAYPKYTYGTFDSVISKEGISVLKESEINTPIRLPNGHYFIYQSNLQSSYIKIDGMPAKLNPGMELSATVTVDRLSVFGRLAKLIKGMYKSI
jgi:membrane fusion protein